VRCLNFALEGLNLVLSIKVFGLPTMRRQLENFGEHLLGLLEK
jgi:hypothetical protein